MPSESMSTTASKSLARQLARTAPPAGPARSSASSSHSSARRRRRRSAAPARRAARRAGRPRRSRRAGARAHQRRALDQLVAGEREQPPLGRRPQRVARAADALQPGRDRARRADQAGQLDGADVDAQLERRGRDDDACSSPSLRRRSARCRRSRDRLPWWAATASAPSRSPRCSATRSTSRRVLTKTSVDWCCARQRRRRDRRARPTARWCTPRRARPRGTSIARSRSRRWPTSTIAGSGRPRRPAGAPRPRAAAPSPTGRPAASLRRRHQRVQPLERQRQVRAALVGGDGVDLVDDHRAHVAQRPPPRLRGQQDEERLGRRHQHVRRPLGRLAPLARGRVAGPDRGPDARRRVAQLRRQRPQLGERLLEVAADVVRQRLQRRDVKDAGPVGQRRRRPRSPRRPGGRAPRGTPPASFPSPSAP